MFIGSPYNLKNKVSSNPILINNKLVPRINKYSCLGVTMDERLSWDKHIDSICSKVGAGISCNETRVVIDPYMETKGMPPMTSCCSGSNEYAKYMTSLGQAWAKRDR
jgi:hypothetical protein